jgi:hypothetical protein
VWGGFYTTSRRPPQNPTQILGDKANVSRTGWPPSPGLSVSGKVRRARNQVARPAPRQNTLRPRSPGLRGGLRNHPARVLGPLVSCGGARLDFFVLGAREEV